MMGSRAHPHRLIHATDESLLQMKQDQAIESSSIDDLAQQG